MDLTNLFHFYDSFYYGFLIQYKYKIIKTIITLYLKDFIF